MKRNTYTLVSVSIALMIIISGCPKEKIASPDDRGGSDDNDKPAYVTKADSIITHGGNGRIEITWLLQSDSNVYSYKVNWYKNNLTDFVENKINKVDGRNIIHLMVNSLEEGSYYFEIRMYDKAGNVSAKSTATGVAYGPQYQSSLPEADIRSINRSGDDAEVNFEPGVKGLVHEEVKYQDVNGDSVVQFIPKAGVSYTIKGLPVNGLLKFRSAYLPDPAAIDTFYTNYLIAQVGKEYKVVEHYDSSSKTYYYLTRINHTDAGGNLIKLRHAFAGKAAGETGSEFAARMNCLLAFNGSTARNTKSSSGEVIKRWPTGTQIIDGTIIQEFPRSYYSLGIKADNKLVSYPPGTTAADMLDDGAYNELSGFIPLIENHLPVSESVLNVYGNRTRKDPRQVIAQYDNLDLLFLSCGGRGIDGEGMTTEELINVFKEEQVKFAFMIDGGGSVTVVADGRLITKKIDNHGKEERPRPNFLYIN